MAEHYTLWIPSGATRINEDGTLAWLLFFNQLMDFCVWNLFSNFEEIVESKKASVFAEFLWQFCHTPSDKCFYFGQLIYDTHIQLKLLDSINDDNLSLGVLGLVLAGIGPIRGINTTDTIVVHDGTVVSDGPFWGIKSHDIYNFAFVNPNFVESLREGEGLIPVVLPGPHVLFLISHDPHGWVITSLHRCPAENSRDRLRFQILRKTSTSHFDGQFLQDVCRPIQVLAIVSLLKSRHTFGRNLVPRALVDYPIVISGHTGALLRNRIAKDLLEILIVEVSEC
jgi:hypothetical protein